MTPPTIVIQEDDMNPKKSLIMKNCQNPCTTSVILEKIFYEMEYNKQVHLLIDFY